MSQSWLDGDSMCDDDARDMVQARLFTREWRLVGTPLNLDEEESTHLAFFFQETYSPDTGLEAETVVDPECEPIAFNPKVPQQFEVVPISKASLLHYYGYYQAHVSRNVLKDQLISLCRRDKKSPCFDIVGCYVIHLKHPELVDSSRKFKLGDKVCVAVVPSHIIETVIEYFQQVSLRINMSEDDVLRYNYKRIRLSSRYTCCEIPEHEWTPAPDRHLSRIVKCKAVTTATLTVSMLLTPVYGTRATYQDRKNLEVVVHAIK